MTSILLENKKKFSKHKAKAQVSLHTMLMPALVFAIVFSIIPLFGLVIAFQDYKTYKGIFGSEFVYFLNFIALFKQPNFYEVLRNTIVIAVAKIIVITVLSVVMALLINEIQNDKLKKTIQVTIFLPYFLSWVLIGGVFNDMFASDGAVNNLLKIFGVHSEVNWLTKNEYFRGIIVATDVWKNLGYQVVVFLAAMTGINTSLYEAAEIDGAGHWQKCWHITIPGIKSMIVLMSILNIGNIMNAGFEQILVMYNDFVLPTGDILDTLAYRYAFPRGGLADYSFSTAVGLFKSVVSCIFFIIAYRIAFKVSDYKLF